MKENQDRANIDKIENFIATHYDGEDAVDISKRARRVYGGLRRQGLNSEGASNLVLDTSSDSIRQKTGILEGLEKKTAERNERREADQKTLKRARKMLKIGYKETLEEPEGYLYHGANYETVRSVQENGLAKSGCIDWWNGNQKLHQNPENSDFQGFGYNGVRFRVRKTDLEELGFRLEGFESTDLATRAFKDDPVVPPEFLDYWDEEMSLWLPVVEEHVKTSE